MNFIDLWRRHDFGAVARRIASKTPADVRRALGRARGLRRPRGLRGAPLARGVAPSSRRWRRPAHQYTVERFGRTMRLYAPLYLSNACANVCTYCGFSAHNRIRRKVLSDAEILAEARRAPLARLRQRAPRDRRDRRGSAATTSPTRCGSCGRISRGSGSRSSRCPRRTTPRSPRTA